MERKVQITGSIDVPAFAEGYELGEYLSIEVPVARITKRTERLKVDHDSGDTTIIETIVLEMPEDASATPIEQAMTTGLFADPDEAADEAQADVAGQAHAEQVALDARAEAEQGAESDSAVETATVGASAE